MGECYITRRGGSGGGKAFAVIGVTYPAGSVCTCTDGAKTLTLKDTGGQGFFLIPYAAVWTVTASDGTNTKAQSVEITAEGQSATVSLSYGLVLVKNGVVKDNPLSLYRTTSFATFQTAENVFRVAANNTSHLTAYFDNLIPITDYSKVAITIAGGRTAYNLFFGLVRDKKIGIDNSGSDYYNNTRFDIASVSFGKGILPAQTKEIDLSSITSGSYYLGFAFGTTGGFNDSVYRNGGFDLADVVLTK